MPLKPTAFMVFQDGPSYMKEDGQVRVPVVFDNLIAAGDLPPLIAIFVTPGTLPPDVPGGKTGGATAVSKYDGLGDRYARCLLEELLPAVERTHKLSRYPSAAGWAGIKASGGICAWTAAWERPDEFRRALSHVGSFTNIRGGYAYPGLIRKSSQERRSCAFLQEGEHDLDNLSGNRLRPADRRRWTRRSKPASMITASVMGDGGHNGKHGGVLMPDRSGGCSATGKTMLLRGTGSCVYRSCFRSRTGHHAAASATLPHALGVRHRVVGADVYGMAGGRWHPDHPQRGRYGPLWGELVSGARRPLQLALITSSRCARFGQRGGVGKGPPAR
jgi:enterochelin esterase family protein